MSAFGAGGSGFQPFALGGKRMSFAASGPDERSNSLTMALTDKEIDERVSSFLTLSEISVSDHRSLILRF